METFKIILWIIVIVLIVLLIIGEVFCQVSMSRRFKKGIIYKTRNRIYDTQDVEWFKKHNKETSITSSRGVKLVGYVFEHDMPCDHWMIVVHGYSSQALNMANYIKGFYNLGYNVLAPELMGMGKSDGEYVAMAGYDADDVMLFIEKLNQEHPNCKIGLMGASMGAATVMNTLDLGLPKNVEFFIEDSGYTNLWDQVRYQMRTIYHLDYLPVIHFASLTTKRKYGYHLKDVDAEPGLKSTKLPGLVLHGADDDFVPTFFADRAYSLLTGPKEMKYFDGCRHIRAEHQVRDEYWKTVTSFLKKYSSKYENEGK